MSDDNKTTQNVNVEDLVLERDAGARDPAGMAGYILTYTALAWSLFQLWIASPLPYALGDLFSVINAMLGTSLSPSVLIFNDTEARAIHLSFAMFLAFTAYPTFINSPRHFIPLQDWVMALVGAAASAYLFVFYQELATRPGLPTQTDIIVSSIGVVLLLEAARRSLGLPLMIVGMVFLIYTFFGSAEWMPELIQHKGQSFNKVASHQWLSTEGVFGIALGVSTSFVFLFVLFGSLLDKAGAGNYFIKVAFSLLGHLRGGPAKAAVLASGLTGFISGSSIANVVTTGTFTIPLMKRVGFTSEKAGAVEVAGSVNGQIMPPVMGAAAFLMVEYVGISYSEVIKHAFLPAVISYIALLYIVHLEALKANMQAIPKEVTSTLKQRLLMWGIMVTSLVIFAGGAFFIIDFLKTNFGSITPYIVGMVLLVGYVMLIRFAAKYPDLEVDDPSMEIVKLPETAPTVKTGLHFLIPVVVLVWCLMVERLSPGLSAFWASIVMIFILITQRPLMAWFRDSGAMKEAAKVGFQDLMDGLLSGARNMIGIGVATAAAGIIVGTVSLTGIGQVMTEIVEVLSGGSLILVLVFTAIISLILGMGLPTTANYIVVSSLMVGVVQELGAAHGLIVPAIAIHMFVFYFGIMADVTPPVGLASFAAAAISKGDPIRTGFQAFVYSTRTAVLPFFFIFNNSLLLIGVDSFAEGLVIFIFATIAILVFSAALQGYFFTRSRIHESVLLLLISVTLFLPQLWMNLVAPPYSEEKGMMLGEVVMGMEPGEKVTFMIEGEDKIGDVKISHIQLTVEEGQTAESRLEKSGLITRVQGDDLVVDDIVFASAAEDAGIFFDDKVVMVKKPQAQPDARLLYIPALLLLGVIIIVQRSRHKRESKS